MFSTQLLEQAEAVLEQARQARVMLCTAESCTGGLIAALLTEIPGSSHMFLGSYVTYANAAKQHCLGISESMLKAHGAVSEAVARAMSEGAATAMQPLAGEGHPVLCVSVTGIAGPGGGSPEKPVGTVHIASHFTGNGQTLYQCQHYKGTRHDIRMAAVLDALRLMRQNECMA